MILKSIQALLPAVFFFILFTSTPSFAGKKPRKCVNALETSANLSQGYCSIKRPQECISPQAKDLAQMAEAKKNCIKLRKEFYNRTRSGRGISRGLWERVDNMVRLIISYEGRFGSDVVHGAGLLVEKGDLAQIINYNGHVPSREFLDKLQASLLERGDRYLLNRPTEEAIGLWKLDLGLFQQATGLFQMVYPEAEYNPDIRIFFTTYRSLIFSQ